MSFNLPPDRLLKRTSGDWAHVQYPTEVVLQANLTPRDFFEPVDPQTPRSCVPAGGRDFSYLFDANTGKMILRGPTMFPPISVTFEINGGTWDVVFVGRLMQLSQTVEQAADLGVVLTHFEHTIPALLSLATGLSIFVETVEIALGDKLEARVETLLPPASVRVIHPENRVGELRVGIEMLGFALSSARFILACSYLREAVFFDASYHEHNPYRHSLIVVLKCAQAIEVLFGGQRDAIRKKCRLLGISDEIIEAHIVPITLARSTLGSAHASSFVPNSREVQILRQFAKRSVDNVRQLLLQVTKVEEEKRKFLTGALDRDRDKEELLVALERSLKMPQWSVEGDIEVRHVFVPDHRLNG